MIPAAFVSLVALPLTPNGKIDRKALPAPDYGSSEIERCPPRTPVEQRSPRSGARCCIPAGWGYDDNFFDLGGHSLLATQLLSRINRALDIELTLRQLFETPTVRGLAMAALEKLVMGSEAEAIPAR